MKKRIVSFVVFISIITGLILSPVLRSEAASFQWNMFSDTYFYDRMNSTQKAFYDRLNNAVEDFFNNNLDAVSSSSSSKLGQEKDYYFKNGISFAGMNVNEALAIYNIYCNSNPQYYFLASGLYHSQNNMAFPTVYPDFAKGADRKVSNDKFKTIVSAWIDDVLKYPTPIERQRRIHSMLADKFEYATANKEYWYLHQSSSTAVFTGKTVCAGYSEVYALLCKAVGIECLCITSDEHEWNMVKQGDYWYVVDLTNDDSYDGARFKYFNVSSAYINDSAHRPSNIFISLGIPKAEFNYDDTPGKDDSNISPVYRLENMVNGEHLFTVDLNEMTKLSLGTTWKYLKVEWNAPSSGSNSPIYRMYNPRSGEHHYTMDLNEVNYLVTVKKWNNEGIKFYSYSDKGVPVYRLFNPRGKGPGNHQYTTSTVERDAYVKSGWINEGICWYGY